MNNDENKKDDATGSKYIGADQIIRMIKERQYKQLMEQDLSWNTQTVSGNLGADVIIRMIKQRQNKSDMIAGTAHLEPLDLSEKRNI